MEEKLKRFNDICSKFLTEYEMEDFTKEEKKLKCTNFIRAIIAHYVNEDVLPELYEEEYNNTYFNFGLPELY